MSGFTALACALELPSETMDVERDILAEAGAELIDRRGVPLDALDDELSAAHAVLTEALGHDRFDASRVARLARCRVISVYAVGTDGVDIAAASARGITVANVPGYCTIEVAEHAVALLLAAWRRLKPAERIARSGSWDIERLRPVHRLAGRTVGLVGFGAIAREVAARLVPFGVRLLVHDPHVGDEQVRAHGARPVGLEPLLDESDVVSLHAPLTSETRGLLGRDELQRLRPAAILVNASRGGLVDYDALLEALEGGRLAGAALDVMPQEPPARDHPLLARDDVLCTPHMGYYSEEALLELRTRAARNAALVLRGEPALSAVAPSGSASTR